jgi:hypothetical protein
MTENWEDAILHSIDAYGGQAALQQIYKIISCFVTLTDEHLRKTQWGDRPAYQHTIRSYVSNMRASGELSRIDRGEYRLTEEGRRRLRSTRT